MKTRYHCIGNGKSLLTVKHFAHTKYVTLKTNTLICCIVRWYKALHDCNHVKSPPFVVFHFCDEISISMITPNIYFLTIVHAAPKKTHHLACCYRTNNRGFNIYQICACKNGWQFSCDFQTHNIWRKLWSWNKIWMKYQAWYWSKYDGEYSMITICQRLLFSRY